MSERTIYLDAASTTRPYQEVIEEMNRCNDELWYNPSGLYEPAHRAKQVIEDTREIVAAALNGNKDGVIFTSSGSESDNMALVKVAEWQKYEYGRNYIVTSVIEHHAILHTCDYLKKRGFHIVALPVDESGLISLNDLTAVINELKDKIALVSIMTANNEIGTIEPISAIGDLCHSNGILFHTDAVQAFGHIPIDVKECHIDLLSASAHKLNGPRGVGLLYFNPKTVTGLKPFINGGGQEHGLRASTENTSAIAGFGVAVKKHMDILQHIKQGESEEAKEREYLYDALLETNRWVYLNGSESFSHRLDNNLNIRFYGVNSQQLQSLLAEDGIFTSIGSACNNGDPSPSHVLKAIGLSDKEVFESIRFTVDGETSIDDLDDAVFIIGHYVELLRDLK